MKWKLKISCEEATMICTKSQYGEASWTERFKLGLHFLYCKVCKMYSKQNSQISDICGLAKKQEEIKQKDLVLSDEFKHQLQDKITKEIE